MDPISHFLDDTSFGMLHFHTRCLDIEVENCKRVLERHNYIIPSYSV